MTLIPHPFRYLITICTCLITNKKNIDGDLNIFSKQMIIDFYKKLNYKYISYKPFFIKKKLTRDKKSGRKSYTIKFNNRLNTFTGPVYLPWGFMIFKKK